MFEKLIMGAKLRFSSSQVREAFSILQADPKTSSTTALSEFLDHRFKEYLAEAILILHTHPEISKTNALLEFFENSYKVDWAYAIICIDATFEEGITSEQHNKLLNYYQGTKETRIGSAFRYLFKAELLANYCDEILDWGATLDNDGFSRVIAKLYEAKLLHLDNLETVLDLPLLREKRFSDFLLSIDYIGILSQIKINHFAKRCESGVSQKETTLAALQKEMDQCLYLPSSLRRQGNGSDSQKSRANIRKGTRFIHQSVRTNGLFANLPNEIRIKIAAHCGEETQDISERKNYATKCYARLGMK